MSEVIDRHIRTPNQSISGWASFLFGWNARRVGLRSIRKREQTRHKNREYETKHAGNAQRERENVIRNTERITKTNKQGEMERTGVIVSPLPL